VVEPGIQTVEDVLRELEAQDYLADQELVTAVFLALRLGRPLFVEGEPGTGKSELPRVLAKWIGGVLIRLQCHDGLDAAQATYEWDYPRQLLHLRAQEAAGANLRAMRRSGAGAARRRDRSSRRRVRSFPARAPERLGGHGARDRHAARRATAGRRKRSSNALAHVDEFVDGGSLAALEDLAARVRRHHAGRGVG
jgi:hypothetical protein